MKNTIEISNTKIKIKSNISKSCTLEDCSPGLFVFEGGLFFKSEYRTQNSKGFWQTDAYNLSGEYFWPGNDKYDQDRENIPVFPVEVA